MENGEHGEEKRRKREKKSGKMRRKEKIKDIYSVRTRRRNGFFNGYRVDTKCTIAFH